MDVPNTRALYARVWRWHFYAAFLVIPFVLWQGVTGVVYLWHNEIADQLWPQQRFVTVSGLPHSLDHQAEIACLAHPGALPRRVRVFDDPRRSTMFIFEAENGLEVPSFVNPYTSAHLGSVAGARWLPGLSRELHGGWPLGTVGSLLLELGACWAIVMVLSGLYLWWPRQARGMAGVLYPRLRHGRRLFWRDLHAVVGAYLAVVFLAFLLTALPWTSFWGGKVLKPVQRATGQVAPGFGVSALQSSGSDADPDIGLQRAWEIARAEGLRGVLDIQPNSGLAPITVRMQTDRASSARVLQIDRHSGSVLARVGWQDYPVLPKLIATGVDLHEGRFFGRANQWFNSALVASLFWLVITGFMGWYRRRPNGGLAVPPRTLIRLPNWLIAVAISLCVVLPLLGISVLVLLTIDLFLRPALARW